MKKVAKSIFLVVAVAAVSAGVSGLTTYKLLEGKAQDDSVTFENVFGDKAITSKASYTSAVSGVPVDLTEAAEKSLNAVVHIRAVKQNTGQQSSTQSIPDLFEYFFGGGSRNKSQTPQRQVLGFGSGVVISNDGYIVTNHHVINGADELTVKLNDNREYSAKVVGQDESSDLALIKVEADDMPAIVIGNSDDLKVGEWVLAVGNPFNLTSTVTAGIVSAKARSLGMYNQGVESFIQTDAAINRGNSGGALVNARGELVGINSVLSSPTGTYAGYGFAIPTNIMKKVVADFKKYGTVQRAVLGIGGIDIANDIYSDQLAEKVKQLEVTNGVLITEVAEGGASADSGIKVDDVIRGVDGETVNSMADLHGILGKKRPGDKVEVKVIRNKQEMNFNVVLKNLRGNTDIIKDNGMEILGAEFAEVKDNLKKQLNIGYGVQITDVKKGRIADSGIRKGFIVLRANDKPIKSKKDLERVVQDATKKHSQVVFVVGMYPNGRQAYAAVDLTQS